MKIIHKKISNLNNKEREEICCIYTLQQYRNPYQDIESYYDKQIILIIDNKDAVLAYMIFAINQRKIYFLNIKEFFSRWFFVCKDDSILLEKYLTQIFKYIKKYLLKWFLDYFSIYFWIEYHDWIDPNLIKITNRSKDFLLKKYYTVFVDLIQGYDNRYRNLNKKVRYEIKKSKGFWLEFVCEENFEEFNNIIKETYERWKLEPHKLEMIYKNEKIFFVKKGNTYLSTTKIIYSEDIAIYFNAWCTQQWYELWANYFMINSLMHHCMNNWIRYFDFRWANPYSKDTKKLNISKFKSKFWEIIETPVLQIGSTFFIFLKKIFDKLQWIL